MGSEVNTDVYKVPEGPNRIEDVSETGENESPSSFERATQSGSIYFHSYNIGGGVEHSFDFNNTEYLDSMNIMARTYQGVRFFSGDEENVWFVGPSFFWEVSAALAKLRGSEDEDSLESSAHFVFGGALTFQMPGALLHYRTGVISRPGSEAEEYRDKDLVMTYGLGYELGIKEFEKSALSFVFDISGDKYGGGATIGLGWYSF